MQGRLGAAAFPSEAARFRLPPVPIAVRSDWSMRKPRIAETDGLVSFVLFSCALFIWDLSTYGALLYCVTVVAYVLCRPAALRPVVSDGWPVLAFPAVAILSTLWSVAPYETAKHSIEYLVTIVGALLLANAWHKRSMVSGMFLAFALYSLITLAVGRTVEIGTTGNMAMSGLNASKNEQASVVTMGFLVTALFFLQSKERKQIAWCGIALPIGAVQIYEMVMAQSAGAVAALAASVGALLMLLLVRHLGPRARLGLILMAGFSALSVGVLYIIFNHALVDLLSSAFDKSPTLTGRTYLWARAAEVSLERPLGGMGFVAFWQHGNLDAEGLWQFAHIQGREGFNFHSTFYDVLIGMGYVGVVVFALTLIVGVGRAAASYIRRPTALACFWVTIAVYLLIRMPIETIGLSEFYGSTVLLFAMLGSASSPDDEAVWSERG